MENNRRVEFDEQSSLSHIPRGENLSYMERIIVSYSGGFVTTKKGAQQTLLILSLLFLIIALMLLSGTREVLPPTPEDIGIA